MKHIFFFVILIVLCSTSLFGQKILTTNSEQRILLVDNGSWRLLGETEFVGGESSESGTSLGSFKSPKQGKYPITLDQREEIRNLLVHFMSDEAQLIVNIEMAKRKLNHLQNKKSQTKNDKGKSEKIKTQITRTKESIRSDERDYKTTSKLIEISNNLLDGKIKNINKAFASLETNSNSIEAINSGMGGLNSEDNMDDSQNPEVIKSTLDKKYPTLFGLEDSRGSKDDYNCEIVFDGYDNEIGSDRKEVKTQPFFSFSQEKMKPYFKTEDYLSCDANISKVGKKHYLTLKIRIRSKDADKTYGALRLNENIKLQLIDGRNVYGHNINTDEGQIESYTGHTLYTGIFLLSKSDIKELKNHYLDNIGIIWSSGYEEYDIYNVDFLTNQIKCLNK